MESHIQLKSTPFFYLGFQAIIIFIIMIFSGVYQAIQFQINLFCVIIIYEMSQYDQIKRSNQ